MDTLMSVIDIVVIIVAAFVGLCVLLMITSIPFLFGWIGGVPDPKRERSEPAPESGSESAPTPIPPAHAPQGSMGAGYVRTNIGVWTVPEHLPGAGDVAECPQCQARERLSLLWLEGHPSSARFRCTHCGAVWLDPTWATTDAIDYVLNHPSAAPPVEERVSDPREVRMVDPASAQLLRQMKREESP